MWDMIQLIVFGRFNFLLVILMAMWFAKNTTMMIPHIILKLEKTETVMVITFMACTPSTVEMLMEVLRAVLVAVIQPAICSLVKGLGILEVPSCPCVKLPSHQPNFIPAYMLMILC